MPTPLDAWPPYCCAILRTPEGRFLLESRRHDARHAPNQLTCFGGRREADESPESCLRRELLEELGWAPGPLSLRVRLYVADELIAWFYEAAAPRPEIQLTPEPGRAIELLDHRALADAPLSAWHRAALLAYLAEQAEARIEPPPTGAPRKPRSTRPDRRTLE